MDLGRLEYPAVLPKDALLSFLSQDALEAPGFMLHFPHPHGLTPTVGPG